MAEAGWSVVQGDCLDVLRTLEDASVDSVVTDPPYGLTFMGKGWDHGVPGEPYWREALRVAKPGAHLLAFGGTRTHHRLMVAIEDAGWEIRDVVMWVYGSGFSKSWNLRRAGICDCPDGGDAIPCAHPRNGGDHGQQATEHDLRLVREGDLQAPQRDAEERNEGVQPLVQQHAPGSSATVLERGHSKAGGEDDGAGESGMGWWDLHRTGEGVPDDKEPRPPEGAAERVCAGAHLGGGGTAWAPPDAGGGSSPHQPRQGGQQAREPTGVCAPSGALDGGTLHGRGQCPRCGKLRKEYEGFGTALKPSYEPIIVARKPLIGTVAENVLRHGTGALNIDGCRVGVLTGQRPTPDAQGNAAPTGRWPSNLIHDGSDEVVGLFPQSKDGIAVGGKGRSASIYGSVTGGAKGENQGYGGSGSAARFFYCAKASKADRDEGCEGMPVVPCDAYNIKTGSGNSRDTRRANHHPTVKPTTLMRYLCRLVTPPGGIVLDPFMGSGSTGNGALLEGFRFIGIDQKPEYCEIARSRLAHAAANVGVQGDLGL